jgi:hypothetical protein
LGNFPGGKQCCSLLFADTNTQFDQEIYNLWVYICRSFFEKKPQKTHTGFEALKRKL